MSPLDVGEGREFRAEEPGKAPAPPPDRLTVDWPVRRQSPRAPRNSVSPLCTLPARM
jgi:hypothetical protein